MIAEMALISSKVVAASTADATNAAQAIAKLKKIGIALEGVQNKLEEHTNAKVQD